ncbi:hypothetical protein [Lacticaseibacillus kribbianus]|uniref:hypothetical protein n=1 Tax=Lacticaseibacillus kribbianus TaxID=2926292 RepID=UPI001CD7D2B9|nr:hypothetical protein [Lacticaseibacillus kribbianus]
MKDKLIRVWTWAVQGPAFLVITVAALPLGLILVWFRRGLSRTTRIVYTAVGALVLVGVAAESGRAAALAGQLAAEVKVAKQTASKLTAAEQKWAASDEQLVAANRDLKTVTDEYESYQEEMRPYAALQEADARKQTADKEAAAAVEDLLNALPDSSKLTGADQAKVKAARAAYNKLTPDQKKLVADAPLVALEKALPAVLKKEAAAAAAAKQKAAAAAAAAKKAAADKAAAEARGYETGITYSQLARTPDSYEGKKVKFSGTVAQILEGDETVQARIAVNGDYDTMLYAEWPSSAVTSRVLEDDTITIYGVSTGLLTYESTMGGNITIPSVLVAKIDQ